MEAFLRTGERATSLARLLARDTDVEAYGETIVLQHGVRTPVCYLFFHGLSASPKQFDRFAADAFAAGHNVLVPRLPRHGHERMSTALANLSAHELRAFAHLSFDAAQALGERVVVCGFSLGGLLATWTGLHNDAHRVVAIAPFFGISWVPNRWMAPFAALLAAMPNQFHWWDPMQRERLMPEHGYPRYATHAIAQMYALAREVLDHSARHRALTRRFTFVTNAREAAVNNRAVARLAQRLQAHAGIEVQRERVERLPPSHDIVEPLARPNLADRVYPQLLRVLLEDL